MKDFKEIIDAHKGIVFKVTKAYAKGSYDFDDLYQEITIQIWKSLPNFKATSKLSTYIYRVSLNTAINFRRRATRLADIDNAIKEETIQVQAIEPVSEEVESLNRAIQLLPSEDRAIILLYLDQYSHQEISEVIGISTNYVGVKINRIKKKLFEIIGKTRR